MYKTLIKVVLALIVVFVASYFLQNRGETPEQCVSIDGYWNVQEQSCEQKTEKIIFQSLLKPHPVSIVYPENQRLVVLDKAEQADDAVYLRGFYNELIEGSEGDQNAVYDRGAVFFNLSKLTLLDQNRENLTYFSAPFEINTAGKGVFTYLGLFSYNFASKESKHLSSELLGNRIREANITLKEPSIVKDNVFVQEGIMKVSFKSHSPTQAAVEYPTQLNQITLQLVALDPNNDSNAKFRRITIEPKNTDDAKLSACEAADTCE